MLHNQCNTKKEGLSYKLLKPSFFLHHFQSLLIKNTNKEV